MKNYYIKLEFGNYYHIYNRGINGEDLFLINDNFVHFFRLYEKYIDPIAETYAWVLMKNHFHFLVRLKEIHEISLKELPDPVRVSNPDRVQGLKEPHLYFSHLFNAYTQAFNKKHRRHGSLFERPFKRLLIDNEKYLKNLVVYIHQNPVYHGFVDHILDYPWSSYLTLVSVKPTKLSRKTVLGWFDDVGNFRETHKKELVDDGLDDYIIE
ncbi:MAG: hypothetical protein B6D61_04845 [Bacteroidetes bacterium 4484_249]|nr:MAG: hypothetical protein B6D61_04845 [Bacteroidetes bacterium 4484_249]